MVEVAASILLLIGVTFALIGSIGLVRMPDFYTRMHPPTKATTLGVSGVLGAAALVLPGEPLLIALKAGLLVGVLFLTAPIGAHMLARAARYGGVKPSEETHIDELPPAPLQRKGEELPPEENG